MRYGLHRIKQQLCCSRREGGDWARPLVGFAETPAWQLVGSPRQPDRDEEPVGAANANDKAASGWVPDPPDQDHPAEGKAFQQLWVECEEAEHCECMGYYMGSWFLDCQFFILIVLNRSPRSNPEPLPPQNLNPLWLLREPIEPAELHRLVVETARVLIP